MTIEDKPKTTDSETTTMNSSFEPSALTKHCPIKAKGNYQNPFGLEIILEKNHALKTFRYLEY